MRNQSLINVLYVESERQKTILLVPFLRKFGANRCVEKEFIVEDCHKLLEIDVELDINQDLINCFSVNSSDFEENMNSIIRVTKKQITFWKTIDEESGETPIPVKTAAGFKSHNDDPWTNDALEYQLNLKFKNLYI